MCFLGSDSYSEPNIFHVFCITCIAGVVAVGSFQLETVNGTNNSTEKLPPKLLLNNQTITWAGGWSDPPKDTPKCGFHGELCPKEGIGI